MSEHQEHRPRSASRARPGLLVASMLLVAAVVWFATRPRPRLPSAPRSMAGHVVDQAGQPVASATVRVRGTAHATTTNADGRFMLDAAGDDVHLTAAREGFLIAGVAAKHGTLPPTIKLQPLPTQDNPAYAWVSPHPDPAVEQQCGNCHAHIYDEWLASSHSRSATNRRFRNLLDGSDWHGKANVGWNLMRDYPTGAGVCTSCHGPTVRADEPAFMDLRQAQGVAADGVHCDLCHKIQETTTPDKFGITHGIHGLDLLRPSSGQLFFGPWDDVDRGEDAFSPLYRESRYCASCHEGTVFGQPVYTTYSEWLASPARAAGKQCQDCHMASTGVHTNVAPGHGGLERDAATLSRHDFPGGELGMLRKALTLSAEITRADGFRLTCTLSAAGAGHSVPTGSADRNIVLAVEAFDAAGQRLPFDHPPDARYLKLAGPDLAQTVGKVYAKAWFNGAGELQPFWANVERMEDTRLKPDQPDKLELALPAAAASIRVRVIYRRFWPQVERAKRWPASDVLVIDQNLVVPQE